MKRLSEMITTGAIFWYLTLFLFIALFLVACAPPNSAVSDLEAQQQAGSNYSVVENQPIPNLGGYSFERQILIETYYARNNTIATYAYMFTMDGKIIEICPSIGYPIPYSTQLSNPMKTELQWGEPVVVPQAEPNTLYPPGDAAATLVQCVNSDGSVSPVYIEWYVLAFPYRIVSDYQLQRVDQNTSFSVKIQK